MSLLSRRQQMQLSVPTAPSQLSIDSIFEKDQKVPRNIAPQAKALQVPTKKSEGITRSSRRKLTASKSSTANSGALCMTAAAMAPVALRCFLNGQGGSHYSLQSDYIRHQKMAKGKASAVTAADEAKQLMRSAMHSPQKGKIQQWSSVAAGAAMALAVCRAAQSGQRTVNKELSAILKTATSTVPVSGAPNLEKLERAFQMQSSGRSDSESVLTQDSGNQTPGALEVTIPTESDLLELFIQLQGQQDMEGCIGLKQVREAIMRLNEKYEFGLVESHAPMLALFMKKTGGRYDGTICPVRKEEFVAGLARLFASFSVLQHQNLSVQELRNIIVHAYEHFDTNGDQEISFEEFKVASAAIGLDLGPIDEGHLVTIHEFFCPTQEEQKVMSEVENSSWKNFQELLTSKIEGVMQNNKIKQLAHIGENIMQAIQKPGTIPEKMERGIAQAWEGADQLLEMAEGAVDAASMAVATAYLQHEVQATLEVGQVEDLDFTTLAPFVLFLGANLASVAKEFSELVPQDMAIDEALVYARIFNKRNFSQEEYMKLLHCPGCRLRVAQPGEVIWDSQDESLKLIAKGHASLIRNSQKIGSLLPSSTMGEAEFLQKASYLHNSVVVADEAVLYMEWEQDQLHRLLDLESNLRVKMMSLLVDGLARNINQAAKSPEEISIDSPLHGPCNNVWETMGDDDDEEVSFETFERFMAQSGLQDDLDLTADERRMLFSRVDTDCDGIVTTCELKEVLPHFQSLHRTFGHKAQAFAISLLKGTIDQDSLQNICDALGLVVGDQSLLRIQKHLGIQDGQQMDLVTVLKKLNALYGIQKSLQPTSFTELMTVISRAFDDFDTNGDGMMDLQEFQKMSEVLQLDLSTEQVQALHAFFDTDGDGVVVAQEWKEGCVSPGGLASYVRETIVEQADRKGWSHLEFLISSLYQIMTSPADFSKKWKLAQAAVQDKAEQLADLANGALDMVSIPAAMAGMWRELAGMETLDDVSGLDVAPFLLFLAISSVSFLRRAGEGQITDMRGPEAFVYSKMFEKEDIPVAQFQKLMKSGQAQWSTVKKGEPIPQASDKLHLIVLGSCSATTHCGTHSLLTSGKFVGESQFLDEDDEKKGHVHTESDEPFAVAIEDTTIVTWDIPSLKKDFQIGECIPAQLKCQMKFRHLVTMSLAERLLEQAQGPLRSEQYAIQS